MTNLDLNIVTICNLYSEGMLNGIDDDPLAQAEVNPLRMSENGKIMDCYQVLENVCRQFGAFIVQDNGSWHFARHSELSNDVIRSRIYNYKAFFLYSTQFNNSRKATCNGSDILILDDSPELSIQDPYKRVEVKSEFGDVPAIIYNGDFEKWDGQNFNYWTRYGGINISRIERTIKTTTGEIPSGNYAVQFNEIYNSGKYLEATPVLVRKGDVIKLTYNVGPTNTIPGTTAYLFKMRIKIEQYYLYNQNDGTNFEWRSELATCTNFIENSKGGFNNFTVNFNIPEAPISGRLIIQVYGFQKVSSTFFPEVKEMNPHTMRFEVVAPAYYAFAPVDEFTPVAIDNLALSKSNQSDNKEVDSILHISQQDGFYTNTPEQIKLLFGDYVEQNVNNQSSIDFVPVINDLYAITVNGIYTKGWYEFGKSPVGLPMGLMLAKSTLKAYQRPYRVLSSSFLGKNISYLDIFNVELPNNASFAERIFAIISGEFNLTTNEVNNADYVEIFSKPPKSVDISVPSYPGDPSPPIIQNPNPPNQNTSGIFTGQFTNEFQ